MVTMLQFYNQGTSVLLAWIMAESGVPRKMVDPRQIPPRGTFCRAPGLLLPRSNHAIPTLQLPYSPPSSDQLLISIYLHGTTLQP